MRRLSVFSLKGVAFVIPVKTGIQSALLDGA